MQLQTQSKVCENLALVWFDTAIRELNSLLKKHGNLGRENREEILGSFFFMIAADFDASPVVGMEFEGREYRPVLAFLEESRSAPKLHVSDEYALHNYVHNKIATMLDEERYP